MRARRLVARSLRFYWRTHLPVLAGVALAAAVLTGSLVTGDSVRESLRTLALRRLGQTELTVVAEEGSFRAALALDLERALGAPVAPVLSVDALVVDASRGGRGGGASEPTARVHLHGIDARFLRLAPGGGASATAGAGGGVGEDALGAGEALLGERLAARLGLAPGAELLFRFERPSALPRDVGLIPETDRTATLRLALRGTLPDERLGRFSLAAEQTAPLNAFCSLDALARALGRPGHANLLLVGPRASGAPPALADAERALRAAWRPEDAGLRIEAARGALQLSTERVFLPPALTAAAERLGPGGARGVLGYLVNEVRSGDRAVAYSFAAGVEPAEVGLAAPLSEDGAAVNAWLARALGVGPGDRVTIRYFTIGASRALVEVEQALRVEAVIPVESGDAGLAPALPGLAGKAHCRDWDPGLPVALDRLGPADEAYWEAHRGTPKLYVSLPLAERLWASRFGDRTALRVERAALVRGAAGAAGNAPGEDAEALVALLRAEVDPAGLGLRLVPARARALAQARPTVDFGQLFLGLGFFLVVSALILTALLFSFGVEARLAEVGLLRALGLSPQRLRRLVLAEGACVAAAGALAGSGLGVGYAHAVIAGLRGPWSGAVGAAALALHVDPRSLALGAAASLVAALGAMALALRRAARASPRALLAGGAEADAARIAAASGGPRRASALAVGSALALGAGLAALGLVRGHAAGTFFAAGALLLAGSVGLAHLGLARIASAARRARLTVLGVAIRANARQAGRRLAIVATLAAGVFLVVAVGAHRKDPAARAGERASGTGGFALLVELTRPLLHDLDDPAGREAALASEEDLSGASFVPLRVAGGEDASCLNLHKVARPRLLGVDPRALAARGAFAFASALDARALGGSSAGDGAPAGAGAGARGAVGGPASPWALLEAEGRDPDEVLAIADANTAMWALGVRLGDAIDFTDERGRPFRVRLVALLQGSVLQGSLVVADLRLLERFPSAEGARLVLVDAPPARAEAIAGALRRGLRDLGVEVTPAARRLADYQAVEDTYLAIFLALGGLALALGTVGVAVLVVRATLERRGELALLRALGFSPARLWRLLFVEHAALVLAGLAAGALAGAVAVLPSARVAHAPLAATAAGLGAIAGSALAWLAIAARLGLRGEPADALRAE